MNRRVWAVFLMLCLLSGSGWILDEWWTSPLSGLGRSAWHEALLALLFGGAYRTRRRAGEGGKAWGRIAAWGAGMIGVPQMVIAGTGGRISGFTEVLVFTLVPAIVVILEAQREGLGSGEDSLGKLGPAIAGVGGAALILPFALPESLAGWLGMAALVAAAVLSGLAAVRLHGLLRGRDVLWSTAVICGACAVVCAIGAAVLRPQVRSGSVRDWVIEAAVCLFVDGAVLFVLVWLVGEMKPVGFAARYLLIPAITVVEGFVLLRPEFGWTLGLGLALLVGGGVMLVRRTENLV